MDPDERWLKHTPESRVLKDISARVLEEQAQKRLERGAGGGAGRMTYSFDPAVLWGEPMPSREETRRQVLDALRNAAPTDARFSRSLWADGGAVELMTRDMRSLWAAVGMVLPAGRQEVLADSWSGLLGGQWRECEDQVRIERGVCIVERMWPRADLTLPSGAVESRQVRVILEAHVPSGRQLRFALETRPLGRGGKFAGLAAKVWPLGSFPEIRGEAVAMAFDWSGWISLDEESGKW